MMHLPIQGVISGGVNYDPSMMQYDGETAFYQVSDGGGSNPLTVVLRLDREAFSGTGIEVLFEAYDSTRAKLRVAIVGTGHANAANLVYCEVNDSAGVRARIYSTSTAVNGESHVLHFVYDQVAGTATLTFDNSVEDNMTPAGRVAPSTGTLNSGGTEYSVGAANDGSLFYGGLLGYCGFHHTNSTDPSDFMRSNGKPKELDEITWAEWGSKPEIWNAEGTLTDNKGDIANLVQFGVLRGPTPPVLAYDPGRMTYNGTDGYFIKTSLGVRTNSETHVARFNLASQTGGIGQYITRSRGPTHNRMGLIVNDSDHATPALRNKLSLLVWDDAGVIIARLLASADMTGADHTVFASYDGATGDIIFVVDGVAEDDTGNSSRVPPVAGTMQTTTGGSLSVGATDTPTHFIDGEIGYVGMDDGYRTNASDFMDDSTPIELDESGWTEWGAQPLFWEKNGVLDANKGSAGNMTKNGTITGPT